MVRGAGAVPRGRSVRRRRLRPQFPHLARGPSWRSGGATLCGNGRSGLLGVPQELRALSALEYRAAEQCALAVRGGGGLRTRRSGGACALPRRSASPQGAERVRCWRVRFCCMRCGSRPPRGCAGPGVAWGLKPYSGARHPSRRLVGSCVRQAAASLGRACAPLRVAGTWAFADGSACPVPAPGALAPGHLGSDHGCPGLLLQRGGRGPQRAPTPAPSVGLGDARGALCLFVVCGAIIPRGECGPRGVAATRQRFPAGCRRSLVRHPRAPGQNPRWWR